MRERLQDIMRAVLRALHRAGWPALAGLAAACAALAMLWSANRPLRDEIAQSEQHARELRVQRRDTKPQLSPREQLQRFYASFPPRSSLPQALISLHGQASKHHLEAVRADYRDTAEAGTPLVRVKIEVPVSGSYVDIREWIDGLMMSLPNLTLDGMELRRNDIGKKSLEARVRFQLILRKE